MAGSTQHLSASTSVVWGLIDEQSVIVAHAQVPADQSAAHGLDHLAHGGTPVLRVVDESCPGLSGVGELRHVQRHLLLPPSSRLLLLLAAGSSPCHHRHDSVCVLAPLFTGVRGREILRSSDAASCIVRAHRAGFCHSTPARSVLVNTTYCGGA